MSKYSPIYKYIKQQQKLAKKLSKLQQKEQILRQQRQELQKPFWGGALDVQLYKDFFRHYCIKLPQSSDNYFLYMVTDIVLDTESGTNSKKFWKAQYQFKEYKDKEVVDQFLGSLSLRGIMKLLLQPGASLQKI